MKQLNGLIHIMINNRSHPCSSCSLILNFDFRMELRSAGSYVVATVTFVAVGFLSCLQFMSLPVLMKETILCYFYRSDFKFSSDDL